MRKGSELYNSPEKPPASPDRTALERRLARAQEGVRRARFYAGEAINLAARLEHERDAAGAEARAAGLQAELDALGEA